MRMSIYRFPPKDYIAATHGQQQDHAVAVAPEGLTSYSSYAHSDL